MSASEVKKRILIIAGDSDGNLGDRAILHAMCQELQGVERNIHITAVAGRPGPGNVQIDTIPRGIRGFARLLLAAVRADAIICGGGGLFQDDDSLIKMPYWAMRVLLMRLCCRHIIGYSLGVGPLSAPTSRWSARLAFRSMRFISVRDPIAQRTAQALTTKPITVIPDPASVLTPTRTEDATSWLKGQGVPFDGRRLIGVTVRRWFPAKPRFIPNKIAARFDRSAAAQNRQSEVLCSMLANVLDQLVVHEDAYLLFMPTYNVPHEGDDRLCREIQDRMESNSGKILYIDDAQMYMSICSQLAVLIGGRMHPTLLAAAVGTPVVGLAYNPKFQGAFSMRGFGRQVMDVRDFVTHGLTDELFRLVSESLDRKVDPAAHELCLRRTTGNGAERGGSGT